MAGAAGNDKATSIVLVHGAFADGPGWKAAYDLLSQDRYEVLATRHATATPDGDVAVVASVIEAAKFPVVLVGHSYGGMIISRAGLAVQPGEARAPLLPSTPGPEPIATPSRRKP